MKISYGLTVCNEHEELQHLIEFIFPLIDREDEIVIVYDDNRVTGEVLDVIDHHKDIVKAFPFDFQQNFLENKNYMNSLCEGDFIFQIDADEIPNESLVSNLKPILESNPTLDMLIVPRKNLVKGLTEAHIKKWGWRVNEKGWVNWPDQQKRIYRNTPDIQWTGHPVHGMITGYKEFAALPVEEGFSITHNKQVERQEKQNERYDNIERGMTLQNIYERYMDTNPSGGHGDKGTAHSYINSYEILLEPYRKNNINLLEIGIAYGESLEMWYEYFNQGEIYGVDIHAVEIFSNEFKPGGYKNDDRFTIWIEDATNPKFLDTIKEITFDVVIDDGSHVLSDQVETFKNFKNNNKINPGGIYIIEDVVDLDEVKDEFIALHDNCEIIDLRNVKGRHDDVLIVYKF